MVSGVAHSVDVGQKTLVLEPVVIVIPGPAVVFLVQIGNVPRQRTVCWQRDVFRIEARNMVKSARTSDATIVREPQVKAAFAPPSGAVNLHVVFVTVLAPGVVCNIPEATQRGREPRTKPVIVLLVNFDGAVVRTSGQRVIQPGVPVGGIDEPGLSPGTKYSVDIPLSLCALFQGGRRWIGQKASNGLVYLLQNRAKPQNLIVKVCNDDD